MKMTKTKNIERFKMGDEAPTVKDFLIVIGVLFLLIVFSWIAYFKLGWLH